jgi:hypothetical protein
MLERSSIDFSPPGFDFPLPATQRLAKRKAMTVCIAAIANNGVIVGAADTMLTSGDVEFEPFRQSRPRFGKIIPVTNSIVAMNAGDTGIQAELFFRFVAPFVNAWVPANPGKWMPFEAVVNSYCNGYKQLKRERAEQAILSPYGLTLQAFQTHQREMAPDFLAKISRALADFTLEPTETIITGIEPALDPDSTLSRLWVIFGSEVSSRDTIRFASVGSGSRHADSHFMLSRHSPSITLSETALSVYTAKKKSEVAPGVGYDTNMFSVGPNLGSFSWVSDADQKALHAAYAGALESQQKATRRANGKIEAMFAARQAGLDQSQPPASGQGETGPPVPPAT